MVRSPTLINTILESIRVMAITEDENEISLRDANASRERPRLEGFDMDQDVQSEIEVRNIFAINFDSNPKRSSPSTPMLLGLWISSSTRFTPRRKSSLES
jgi:hypothetical protein